MLRRWDARDHIVRAFKSFTRDLSIFFSFLLIGLYHGLQKVFKGGSARVPREYKGTHKEP